MHIEQAIYGEVKGGHALRAASGDRQFALDIASRLDLPDNAPPGVLWSPYVSGFGHAGYYVLARTFTDASASRSGMVLTHALVMPIAEVVQFRNLEPLFKRLILVPDQVVTMEGFGLHDDGNWPLAAEDLLGAANALTTRGKGPVVRLGATGFEALVISLWANLWSEIRATFSFRLSFGPADIVEDPEPLIVCTPTPLGARWARYRIVSQAHAERPASAAAALVAGTIDPTPLLGFARNIGAEPLRLPDLSLIERAHSLLSEEIRFDDHLAAARLVDRLSPNPMAGMEVKNAIVGHLSQRVASATPGQILALRNLALPGFPENPNLWLEVARWFDGERFDLADDGLMISIITSALSDTAAIEAWRSAVRRGITGAAGLDGLSLPHAFWRWARSRPDLSAAIFLLLPIDHAIEMRMASATPAKIEQAAADPILPLAVSRRWYALHGAVLSACTEPIAAARRQIAVDHDVSDATGIKFALRAASPAQVLKCAIELRDARLVDLAADAVLADPRIFADTRCQDIGEQAVWDVALRRNVKIWEAPHDPLAIRDAILNHFIDGHKVHMLLVEALALTPLADLCDFSRRERVWAARSTAFGRDYLQATSSGWLMRAAQGKFSFQPDATLKTTILSGTALDMTLSGLATDPTTVVRIVEVLDGFTDQRFLVWFKTMLSQVRSLSIDGAEALGRLVLARDWHRVVDEAVSRYRSGRSDLKPMLRISASMVSFFLRWTLDLAAPTTSEKWESFANLAAELYPSGPDDDELWSRAGGKNSDLPKSGSGRSAWRTVIGQIRNGRGPSPTRLLREMRQDYGSNEELRLLANDREIAKNH